MRMLLIAGTALMFGTGMAMAQSSSTNNTGAVTTHSATPGNMNNSAAGAGAAGQTTTPHMGSTIGAGNSHASPTSPTGAAPPKPQSAGGHAVSGANGGGSNGSGK